MTLEYGKTPEETSAMDLIAGGTQGQLVVGTYIRVSTPGQSEKGTSTETQLEKCRQAAREMGESLNPRYIWVEVESGAYMDRPKLDDVRRKVRNREIDILIILVQDRLSRDMVDPLIFARECMEAGVRLHFVEGNNDTSLEGQLLMLVTGYAAQLEHRQITERSLRGKERVAREGRRMPIGTGGLYGYDYDPVLKQRTVNEREAPVVQMMFQWAADGVSSNRIACLLNEMKIPTKRGRVWSQARVRKMLQYESYTGIHYYGKTRWRLLKNRKREATPKPASEWHRIEGFTPPLVTKQFFDTVQQKLATRQARWDGKTRRHLMTGFTRCGKCGGPVIGSMKAREHKYYRCGNSISKPEKPTTCDALSIRGDRLEPTTWDLVTGAIRDPDMISRAVVRHAETGEGDTGEEMKKLRREIGDLKVQENKLLDDHLKTVFDPDIVESKAAQVRLALEEKERSLRILEEQQKAKDDATLAGERVAKYCQRFWEGLEELDLEGRRALFAAFEVKVVATKEDLQVTITVDPGATTMSPTSPSRRCRGWGCTVPVQASRLSIPG